MSIKTIDKNMRVFTLNGKTYQQEKKRSRKRYKMPVKARKKIAAAARRVRIPVLTLTALGVGTVPAIQRGLRGQWVAAGNMMLNNYTGFSIDGSWKFQRLFKGLFPLGMVFLINKTGVLKPVNQKLAKIRGNPLRLN